jgi:hypothetical protein
MNLILTIDQYNDNNVFFCDPIKNNIMNHGNFIRIIYSNTLFILNGIYIIFPFNNLSIEKYYNKIKFNFDINLYQSFIERIKNIEDCILKKINIKGKKPLFKIFEQLKNGCIKIFSENKLINYNSNNSNINFLLKISGIWETESEFGLTYKFLKI